MDQGEGWRESREAGSVCGEKGRGWRKDPSPNKRCTEDLGVSHGRRHRDWRAEG